MRGFSDTLTTELILASMTRAIRSLGPAEITDARKRLSAYEAAHVASEHVRDFDAVAVRNETCRRGLTPSLKKRTA